MAFIDIKNVHKKYSNGTVALDGVSFSVKDGEMAVLCGPSGAGKTVMLKIIAGLEEPDSGEILFDGEKLSGCVKDRDIAMIFEDFGLFKQKTVFENLAYGLKIRKLSGIEVEERVKAAADELNITEHLEKRAKSLPPVVYKKVQLARVLVRKPKIFLLDEPLKALSGADRTEMRGEILRLNKKLGIPFVYATIDPVDAMTLGQMAVVLSAGEVMSVGAPQSLYSSPDNLFTAAFFGEPGINLFKTALDREDGKMFAILGDAKIQIPQVRARRLFNEAYTGKSVILGIRPEDMHTEEVFISASPETVVSGKIEFLERLGADTVLYTSIEGKNNLAAVRVNARASFSAGDEVALAFDANRMHFFDVDFGYSLTGVPKTNRIFAVLNKDGEGKLSISFGGATFNPPEGFLSSVPEADSTDVILEFEPSSLTEKSAFDAATLDRLEKGLTPIEGNFFELSAKVEFTEKHDDFIAAYALIQGKHSLVAAVLPKDSSVAGGASATMVGDYKKLTVKDFKTGKTLN